MVIFGGILELTKELNELLLFNFQTQTFSLIGSESNGDGFNDQQHSQKKYFEDDSIKKTNMGTISPTKLGT